jgi:solute carrier family 25 oxoglutarate transporter 11
MFATCCIQPIDIVKVRLQVRGESGSKNLSPFDVARELRAEGGIKGFYKGIDSALFRQLTYTGARFGIYLSVTQWMQSKLEKGQNLSFAQRCFASLMAGGLGAIVGTPADLVLIRMQTDKTLPKELQRNYKNVFQAFGTIIREESVGSLFKGVGPTMIRAMALNLGMLAPYDQAKDFFAKFLGNGQSTNLAASAVAGFLASAMSLPFDNVKTKVQRMQILPNGKYPYTGMIDCAKQTMLKDGIRGFYVGFPTFYFRIAPHAMITLLAADKLKALLL